MSLKGAFCCLFYDPGSPAAPGTAVNPVRAQQQEARRDAMRQLVGQACRRPQPTVRPAAPPQQVMPQRPTLRPRLPPGRKSPSRKASRAGCRAQAGYTADPHASQGDIPAVQGRGCRGSCPGGRIPEVI